MKPAILSCSSTCPLSCSTSGKDRTCPRESEVSRHFQPNSCCWLGLYGWCWEKIFLHGLAPSSSGPLLGVCSHSEGRQLPGQGGTGLSQQNGDILMQNEPSAGLRRAGCTAAVPAKAAPPACSTGWSTLSIPGQPGPIWGAALPNKQLPTFLHTPPNTRQKNLHLPTAHLLPRHSLLQPAFLCSHHFPSALGFYCTPAPV